LQVVPSGEVPHTSVKVLQTLLQQFPSAEKHFAPSARHVSQ
jgi:hypothetical protein